jgi:hypothetical protein
VSVTVAGSAGPRPASGTNLVAALHAAEPQVDVDATALLQNDAVRGRSRTADHQQGDALAVRPLVLPAAEVGELDELLAAQQTPR